MYSIEMNIKQEKRFLTKNEKDFILENCSNLILKFKNRIKSYGIIMFIVLSILFGLVWWWIFESVKYGILGGVCCLIIMIFFTFLVLSEYFIKSYLIIKKIKDGTMYVKEAKYERTTIYKGNKKIVYLKMYKEGEMNCTDCNVEMFEDVKKGDKVILLYTYGRAWGFKARD